MSAAARTLKLTLAYDGTPFVGWQRQAAGTSIQGLLEEALARIEGGPVAVAGSGRTDAGVHALGQVASATMRHPIPCAALRRALNATLPAEVRVLDVEDVAPSFHARFGARRKTYRYRLLDAPSGSPFERYYAWHVAQPLDADAMREGVGALRGRHDFAAFRAAGTAVRDTVRTMFEARVRDAAPMVALDAPGRILACEFTADGFLRHMVRAIVGTLVEVGLGRRPAGDLPATLASRDRGAAGPTAPPQGLFLVRVDYDDVAARARRGPADRGAA